MKGIIFKSAAVLCLAVLSGTALAQAALVDLPRASSAYVKDYESFKLAANDADVVVKKPTNAAPEVKTSEFEPSWLTGGKVHQYLGLSTIAAAALTLWKRNLARLPLDDRPASTALQLIAEAWHYDSERLINAYRQAMADLESE